MLGILSPNLEERELLLECLQAPSMNLPLSPNVLLVSLPKNTKLHLSPLASRLGCWLEALESLKDLLVAGQNSLAGCLGGPLPLTL